MNQSPWEALSQDFIDSTDLGRLTHVAVRLLMAVALGGMLGFQRERVGKAAGVRTHMLVAAGAAFLVMVPQLEGMPAEALARVIQGVVAGIGFLGGGIILKQNERERIKGLTTAAGIWVTAAIGIAIGLGRNGSAILAAVVAFCILGALHRFDDVVGEESSNAD